MGRGLTFLLDTNVVSKQIRPRRDPGVERFLAVVDESSVFLSVVTIGELRDGVERLRPGPKRDELDLWLAFAVPVRFNGRIVPISLEIAEVWGRLAARQHRTGYVMDTADGYIAATAFVHGLTVVTRNARDFEPLGISVLNPWSG
jgi:predicted nucleic acid-binding protein